MIKYIKCPRCELNYIDSEKQEYCDVCLAELKGKKLQFADLDDEDFEAVNEELDAEELCPICGVNPLRPGEKMCETCKAQQEYEEDDNVDLENDEEWKNYLEEDTDEEDLKVDEELQEEIEEEFAQDEEEDEEYRDDDFYESEDVDSLSDLEDDEYDDDEDEDDDDEDDDF